MSRANEYQFVSTNTDALVSSLTSAYEEITGISLKPASPEKLFIQWVANILVQERVRMNYIGNQNIPSRAEGENLDALGELFYETTRPKATKATATERFYITEAQSYNVLIPKGTRVTDRSGNMYWVATEDVYIESGDTYVETKVECMTEGESGNGFAIGQLNTIVDVYSYYDKCENITVSANGANEATDDEYYDILRASMDGYSSAGAKGAYEYFARRVNTSIGDVIAVSPSAGNVDIYVLMEDGTIAPTEVKNAVLAACNENTVRPLTDHVSVKDASSVTYNINFTYYISNGTTKSATEIEADVQKAVNAYIEWQEAKFGRDINPDKLRELLYETGIKRIVLSAPTFTVLSSGAGGTTPQHATVGTTTIVNGGYEDE